MQWQKIFFWALLPALLLVHGTIEALPSLTAPTPIYVQGNYLHAGTKMRFPTVVAAFMRVGILRFDSSANDIGVAYNLLNPKAPISVNVYIYPKPEVMALDLPAAEIKAADAFLEQNKFHGIKAEIINADSGAQLLTEGDVTFQQKGKLHNGKVAIYAYQDDLNGAKQSFIANAYLFSCGNWFIEYRVNYPKATQALASSQIKKFMHTLKWPKC